MTIVTDPLYKSKVVFGKTKYGRLTLQGLIGYFLEKDNRKKAAFKFLCDCGKETIKTAYDVKRGKVVSCGCYHKEVVSKTGKNNTLSDCEGFRNLLFYRFLKGASNRNKEVEITRSQFESIIFQKCHYCGSEPTNFFENKMACQIKYNGVDRVDSTKQYTLDNVVPCCKHCNWAKNKCTTEEFENWISRLIEYRYTLNRAKTVDGEIPNPVLNSQITKGRESV